MSDLHRLDTGSVAIRSDAEGDGRTIEGYAVKWGELTSLGAAEEFPDAAEGFERGAFADAIAARADRPWPFLATHNGVPVAGIRFDEDDTGLHYVGRMLETQAARDYAATIPAGNDGVSLEFMVRGATSKRRGNAVIHTRVPAIAGLAGTYKPAYMGATIALRSEGDTNMTDTTEATVAERAEAAPAPLGISRDDMVQLVRDTATEVVRGMAERGAFVAGPKPADPFAGYKNLGELMRAAFATRPETTADPSSGATPQRDDLRAYAARALADVVFTSGANAGLASGNLVTTDIKRIVNGGRPAITAFGGPRGLGDTAGLTLEWPYFDGTLSDYVAAQSAEKAEIESATIDIKLDTEALKTYAGGADISYQVLRRGNPSVLDAFGRIMEALQPRIAAVTEGSGDLEQKQSELQAKFETLTGKIGQGLEGPLTSLLTWINEGIDGLGELGLFVEYVDKTIRDALGPIADMADALADLLNQIDEALKGLGLITGGHTQADIIAHHTGTGGGGGVTVNVQGGSPEVIEQAVKQAIVHAQNTGPRP